MVKKICSSVAWLTVYPLFTVSFPFWTQNCEGKKLFENGPYWHDLLEFFKLFEYDRKRSVTSSNKFYRTFWKVFKDGPWRGKTDLYIGKLESVREYLPWNLSFIVRPGIISIARSWTLFTSSSPTWISNAGPCPNFDLRCCCLNFFFQNFRISWKMRLACQLV